MKRSMVPRLQIIFVVIFLAACVGLLFLRPSTQPGPGNDPQARCEARGDWWDDQDKVCAVPTPLATITGRPSKPH
jgi:hypothetical protein